jgi:transformation/transcription domain-associated protein
MYANTKTVVEKEFGEKGGSGLKPPVSFTLCRPAELLLIL